jgi:hypothetical protein
MGRSLGGSLDMSHTLKYYRRRRLPAPSSRLETTHVLRHASFLIWGECGCNRIDLETYGSFAVTLGGSLDMSHTLKYYRRRRLPAHGSTPETTHVLRHASCLIRGECGYDRIDLETYGSCAVTLGRLSHTQILQTQEAPSSQQ